MEINPTDKIPAPVFPEKSSTTEKPAGKTFGTVFEELIDNSKETYGSAKKTPAINNISQIQLNPFMSGREISIVDRAESLLDTLDEYQERLASPEFTLRDISPLIGKMEAGNEILTSAVNDLSDGDELKNILNQVIITSSVEIIKFNRGDYVTP
ncbi:MAG: hypothetical protein JRG75_03725 [Deltaproteobacteria bacterium]|nr:hypothetical protein [Deltaproteobacteria bacterium]